MADLPITTRIPPELAERMERLGERMGLTGSDVRRRVMVLGTERLESACNIADGPVASALLRLLVRLTDAESLEDVERVLDALSDARRREADGLQAPLFREVTA